jgi:phage terminase small subunit
LFHNKTDIAAPAHLSPEAKKVWASIADNWELDEAGLLLLRAGCEAFDTAREARKARRGRMTVVDKYGQTRQHPLLLVEYNGRNQFMHAIDALHLDASTNDRRRGRPPGNMLARPALGLQ